MENDVIKLSEKLLRDIVIYKIQRANINSNKVIFGFEKQEHINLLNSCLDVIGDTELAKGDFTHFGLQGPTRYNDSGEKYLRLYGITNAIYLQGNAILPLLEIFKLPNKNEWINEFKKLPIISLRHKAGAHTTEVKQVNSIKSYHIVRISLNEANLILYNSSEGSSEFNLIELIEGYNDFARKCLIKVVQKCISMTLKNNNSKEKEKFAARLDDLNSIMKGDQIFYLEGEIKDGQVEAIHFHSD